MKIKFSTILFLVGIVAIVLYRKQLVAWLEGQKEALASGSSASTQSPLQNLLASTGGAEKAKELLSSAVDALQESMQGPYAQDLVDRPDLINTSPVSEVSFVDTIRTQEEKILNTGGPLQTTGQAGTVGARRVRDQNWWPDVLHDTAPVWMHNEQVAAASERPEIMQFQGKDIKLVPCSCGCGELKVMK